MATHDCVRALKCALTPFPRLPLPHSLSARARVFGCVLILLLLLCAHFSSSKRARAAAAVGLLLATPVAMRGRRKPLRAVAGHNGSTITPRPKPTRVDVRSPPGEQPARKRPKIGCGCKKPDVKVIKLLAGEMARMYKDCPFFFADQTLSAIRKKSKLTKSSEGSHVRTTMPVYPTTPGELADQLRTCRRSAPTVMAFLLDHLMLGVKAGDCTRHAGISQDYWQESPKEMARVKRAFTSCIQNLCAMVHVGNKKRGVVARGNTLRKFYSGASAADLSEARCACAHVCMLAACWHLPNCFRACVSVCFQCISCNAIMCAMRPRFE